MPIPYDGEELTLYNSDGTELPVHAWGNQFAAVFDTFDGYAVSQDPDPGFFHYPTVSADKQQLLTGARVGAVELDLPVLRLAIHGLNHQSLGVVPQDTPLYLDRHRAHAPPPLST